MAYRIREKDYTVEKAVRRIAREQLDKALDSLDDRDDLAELIHDVRKRCKKLRALIRMVRPAFPDFDEENAAFRDAAELLAGPRDAQVALETFDLIVKEAGGRLSPETFQVYRETLSRDAARPEEGETVRDKLDACRDMLAKAHGRARKWKLDEDGWAAVGGGIEKTYARAYDMAKQVVEAGTDESYHQLRKRMKYHWHHTRLLEQIAPRDLRKRAKLSSDLTELLGQHHDLAVLEARLMQMVQPSERRTVETLLTLSSRRRAILEDHSAELIKRLLHRSPKELLSDWHEKWKAWHR